MTYQKDAFKAAVTQMVELGREYLIQQISSYSKLNQCEDNKERRELEKLYYNEIAATANTIRLFTGRTISFQWQSGKKGNLYGGFALYEIEEDAPCEKIPAGVPTNRRNKYSGLLEEERRINWGKGMEQGKIVKIYELRFDIDANPCYVGGYLVPEFQTA